MSDKEKIEELTKRIEVLENAEKKRKNKKRLKITLATLKYIIIITLLITGYLYLDTKVIKPYKETTNNFKEIINNVETTVGDKIDNIKEWFNKSK